MKVTLKYNQAGYSGELDDLVYYFHPGLGKTLARRKPRYTSPTPAQEHLVKVSKNLRTLIQNQDYKMDLRIYLGLLKEAGEISQAATWYQLFIKLMWKMEELNPALNLELLNHEQIVSFQLPCRSVQTAVEGGLLPEVEGYQRLDNLI